MYNSDYTLVPEEVAVVEKEEIPIMEIPAKPQQITTKIETKAVKAQTQSKPQQVKKVEVKQPVKTETKVQKTTTQPTVPISREVITKTEPAKTVTQTIAQQPKVLTQKEEEIAWNIGGQIYRTRLCKM